MQIELDHVALTVSNIAKSIEWYRENLQADVLYEDETWALLKVGNSKMALMTGNKHKPHVAFRQEDLSQFEIEEIGIHRDGVAYVYKEDPDGNCIECVCYK